MSGAVKNSNFSLHICRKREIFKNYYFFYFILITKKYFTCNNEALEYEHASNIECHSHKLRLFQIISPVPRPCVTFLNEDGFYSVRL